MRGLYEELEQQLREQPQRRRQSQVWRPLRLLASLAPPSSNRSLPEGSPAAGTGSPSAGCPVPPLPAAPPAFSLPWLTLAPPHPSAASSARPEKAEMPRCVPEPSPGGAKAASGAAAAEPRAAAGEGWLAAAGGEQLDPQSSPIPPSPLQPRFPQGCSCVSALPTLEVLGVRGE